MGAGKVVFALLFGNKKKKLNCSFGPSDMQFLSPIFNFAILVLRYPVVTVKSLRHGVIQFLTQKTYTVHVGIDLTLISQT